MQARDGLLAWRAGTAHRPRWRAALEPARHRVVVGGSARSRSACEVRARADGEAADAARSGSARAVLLERGSAQRDSRIDELDRAAVQSGFVARPAEVRRDLA